MQFVLLCLVFCVYAYDAEGQVQNRITAAVDPTQTFLLRGSAHPLARAQNDIGRVSAGTQLKGITIYFKLTAEQKAELDTLVQAQQTPGSAWYHKWLTPAEYANRFGLSDSDIAAQDLYLEE